MGFEYCIRWDDRGWLGAHRDRVERLIRGLPTFVRQMGASEFWLKEGPASSSTWAFDVRVFVQAESIFVEVSGKTRAFWEDTRRLFWTLAAAPYFWTDVRVPIIRLEEGGDPSEELDPREVFDPRKPYPSREVLVADSEIADGANRIYSNDRGDVRVVIQDSAIHIKVVMPSGDAVELNEHETEELVRVLQKFIEKIR